MCFTLQTEFTLVIIQFATGFESTVSNWFQSGFNQATCELTQDIKLVSGWNQIGLNTFKTLTGLRIHWLPTS